MEKPWLPFCQSQISCIQDYYPSSFLKLIRIRKVTLQMTFSPFFTAVHDVDQYFSTFFDSRHPSFIIEQFGGTHSFNLPINRRQVQKLAAPLEFFLTPKDSMAPRLRTNELRTNKSDCLKCNLCCPAFSSCRTLERVVQLINFGCFKARRNTYYM